MLRQEDMDKIHRRLVNILKEVISPDVDYKVVLIVGEREDDDRLVLSLASSADHEVAAWLCEAAMRTFTRQHEEDRHEGMRRIMETLVDALRDGSLTEFMREAMKKREEEKEGADATKH